MRLIFWHSWCARFVHRRRTDKEQLEKRIVSGDLNVFDFFGGNGQERAVIQKIGLAAHEKSRILAGLPEEPRQAAGGEFILTDGRDTREDFVGDEVGVIYRQQQHLHGQEQRQQHFERRRRQS